MMKLLGILAKIVLEQIINDACVYQSYKHPT